MKKFSYNDFEFTGYRNLAEHERDFLTISKKLTITNIVPNWSYAEFYNKAVKADCNFDLFLLNGMVVIPCSRNLFIYGEPKSAKAK